MVLELDDLDETAVRRLAGQGHAGRLERLAVPVVDLEPVAMALVDDLVTVDRRRLGAGRELGRVEAQAHRAALVLHVALVGHEVDDRVPKVAGRMNGGVAGFDGGRRPRGQCPDFGLQGFQRLAVGILQGRQCLAGGVGITCRRDGVEEVAVVRHCQMVRP